MENESKQVKKFSISTIIAFIIILLAVLGLIMLRKPKQIDAPSDTQQEQVNQNATTSTEVKETVTTTTSTGLKDGTTIDPVTGVKTIISNGVMTTITPIKGPTGETPEIKSFVLTSTKSGVCRFDWDVVKAENCNLINITTNMEVKNVGGDDGVIQTSEKGDYKLKCFGNGGKIAFSEVVSCK
ncbi:MAG: hypothetical protein KBD10_01900 [Candidatus Pacebacteria bacterium]|nr:hypothetical protein [Candidatus Paceibacterota bacterium]